MRRCDYHGSVQQQCENSCHWHVPNPTAIQEGQKLAKRKLQRTPQEGKAVTRYTYDEIKERGRRNR